MKNLIIGALVGSLILFIWQFLSWSMLNIHGSQNQYSANQAEILECLEGKLTSGEYFMPTVAPGATSEEQQALMESSAGKPWAKINYREEFKMTMGMNMFRGWIVGFVAILLLMWLLGKIPNIDFTTTILSCLAVGVIGYLTDNYIESVWFETNSLPDLIDAIVAWGLVGTWLGYWLGRG